MSDTAAGVLADLAVARKTLDEWECGPIAIDVCTSLSNDITKSINFTETIGHGKFAPQRVLTAAACVLGPEKGQAARTYNCWQTSLKQFGWWACLGWPSGTGR